MLHAIGHHKRGIQPLHNGNYENCKPIYDIFQDQPISQNKQPCNRIEISPNPSYKRPRSGDPDHIIDDWRWNRPYAQYTLRTASFIPQFDLPNESDPYNFESYLQDWSYDDLTETCWPNVHVGLPSGGMAGSSPTVGPKSLESTVRKSGVQYTLSNKDNIAPKPKGPVSENVVHGMTSKRYAVPGQNTPFLAATGRQTFSSRGADNPFRVKRQRHADANAISKTKSKELDDKKVAFQVTADFETPALLTSDLAPVYSNNQLQQALNEPLCTNTPYNFHGNPFPPLDGNPAERFEISSDSVLSPESNFDNNVMSLDIRPWSSLVWNPGTRPSPFSLSQNSLTEPVNLSSNTPFISEIPRKSDIEDYNIYASDTISFEPAMSYGHGFNHEPNFNTGIECRHPDEEQSDERENMYHNSSHSPSGVWRAEESLNLFTSNTASSHSTLTQISNQQIQDNTQEKSTILSNYNDAIQTPSSLLDYRTDDTGWSPQMFHSSVPPFGSSANSILRSDLELDRPHYENQHQSTILDLALDINRDESSLIFGSAGFSTDSDPFLFRKHVEQTSTAFASNERLGTLSEHFEDRSGGGYFSEINLSDFSGGKSESPCDWFRPEKMPPQHIPLERSLSSSRFSKDFTPLSQRPHSNRNLLGVGDETYDAQREIQNSFVQGDLLCNSEIQLKMSPPPANNPWQNTFVVHPKLEKTADSVQEGTLRKIGRRRGPLDVDTAEAARKMRTMRSCLRCRKLKVKCTPHLTCIPCQKAAASPHNGWLCSRVHFVEYAELFIPEQAVRSFQAAAIDRLLANNVSGYSDNHMEVFVSSGTTYPPIKLTVREFVPLKPDFLAFKLYEHDKVNDVSTLKDAWSPPLGIADTSQDLSSDLTQHIRDIIKSKRNYGEVVYGSTSQLAWDMYEAIRLYQQANPENLFLRSLLMLHAMQYFVNKSITILRDSSEKVLNNLKRPTQLDYSHNPSVRLINLQIKHIMLGIITKTYAAVLEELEKLLRPKEPQLWAPTFCCIMILNMCAEMVQETTDFRIACAMDDMKKSPDGRDKNGNKPSQEESISVCRKLDSLPIANATATFHLMNRTKKVNSRRAQRKAYNPIRDQLDGKEAAELDPAVKELITRVCHIVTEHRDQLDSQAALPSFESSSDYLKRHSTFKKHNSGRLVAAFLKSFL